MKAPPETCPEGAFVPIPGNDGRSVVLLTLVQ